MKISRLELIFILQVTPFIFLYYIYITLFNYIPQLYTELYFVLQAHALQGGCLVFRDYVTIIYIMLLFLQRKTHLLRPFQVALFKYKKQVTDTLIFCICPLDNVHFIFHSAHCACV